MAPFWPAYHFDRSVCVCRCPPPSLLNMPTGVMPLSLMMQQNNLALMRSVLSRDAGVWVVCAVSCWYCHCSLLSSLHSAMWDNWVLDCACCVVHYAWWVVSCVHHIPLERLPCNICYWQVMYLSFCVVLFPHSVTVTQHNLLHASQHHDLLSRRRDILSQRHDILSCCVIEFVWNSEWAAICYTLTAVKL